MLDSQQQSWWTRSKKGIAAMLSVTPTIRNWSKLRQTLLKLVKLRVLILTVLLGIGAWALAGSEIGYVQRGLWPILLTYAVSLANYYWVKKTARLVLAGHVQLTLDVCFSTMAIYAIGSSGSIFLYLLVIIAAAVVFSSHGALRIAALSGICYMLLAAGIIPASHGSSLAANPQDILIVYVALIAVALISGWAARQLETAGSIADQHARDLDELTNRHSQLFDDVAEGIITLDVESCITSINQAACAIIGLSDVDADEYVGSRLPNVLGRFGVENVDALLAKEFSSDVPGELTLENPNRGADVHLNYSVRGLFDQAGNSTGQLFLFNDVSHVRRIEQKLSLHEQMTKLLDDRGDESGAIEEINEKLCMVGESSVMKQVFTLVNRVACSDASVLISGESGTGKELIARAIHVRSPRSNRPFVAINCGAIPENLIESELFGHKKGSFTGAVSDTLGLFRQANGGTIFLDEIGELPLHLQSKLLRVLQEKTVRPVGGVEDINVDVRVLAASNRNLRNEIDKNTFREDLFYRLNVVNIVVPPLRDRKEDIPLLVRYFVLRYCGSDSPLPKISPEVLEILMRHDFPGNIRELENLIERAIVLGGKAILPEQLPDDVRRSVRSRGRAQASADPETSIQILPVNLEEELAKIERDYLMQALEQSDGVKKRAASLLGLNFRSFRYRLKKYESEQSPNPTENEPASDK